MGGGGAGFFSGLLGGFSDTLLKSEQTRYEEKVKSLALQRQAIAALLADPNTEPQVQMAGVQAILQSLEQQATGKRGAKKAGAPLGQFMEKLGKMPGVTQPERKEQRPYPAPGVAMQAEGLPQLPPRMETIPRVPGRLRAPTEMAQEEAQAEVIRRRTLLEEYKRQEVEPPASLAGRAVLPPVPGQVTPGNLVPIPDLTVPGGYRWKVVGEKMPPILSDIEQRVQDRLVAKKLSNTPTNRNAAYLELLKEEAAARREPKGAGEDLATSASDWADAIQHSDGNIQITQVPTAGGLRSATIAVLNKRGFKIEAKLTEAAKLQRATLAEMVQQANMLELLANENKSSIGPWDSFWGTVASQTVGNIPAVAEMRRIAGNLSDMLLRARSGAQINEQEYARLAKIVPQIGDPESNFFSKLTSFRDELNRTIKRRSGEVPLTSIEVSAGAEVTAAQKQAAELLKKHNVTPVVK